MSPATKLTNSRPALWRYARCGERFTNRNQWHACGSFDIEALFAKSKPIVRLYDRFLEVVHDSGPVTVIPQKSRIALQVRMQLAALILQKETLKGYLVLAHLCPSKRFEKVETYSPRNQVHVFWLQSEDDRTAVAVDGPLRGPPLNQRVGWAPRKVVTA